MGDKTVVLQAVLLLLLTCVATHVHSAPFSADDFLQQKQTDLSTLFHSSKGGMIGPLFKQDMPHNWDSPDGGCFYQFQHYEEGDRIITNEPCLNCTCHNSMLMCYLKVCPFSKPIGQDCTIEKRPDQCCPVITCPQVPVNLQVMQMMTSTTTPEPVMSSAVMATFTEHGCTVEGRYYPDGAQVPGVPNKPCELCYCIRNHTACVMQECILKVNGCDPVFEDNICCPVRYKCAYDEIEGFLTTTEGGLTGSNDSAVLPATTTMIPGSIGCMHKGEFYADGASIPTEDPCEHCYCMKSDLVCAIQECRSPLDEMSENCTPRTPAPGQCCPEAYDCPDRPEVTPVTVSNTTEVYAVTTTEALLSFQHRTSGETTIKPFQIETGTGKPTESIEQTYQTTGITTDDDQAKTSTKIYEETAHTVSTETSTGISDSQISTMAPESPNGTGIQADGDNSFIDSQTSEKPIHIGSATSMPSNETTSKVPDETSTNDYSPESGVEPSSTLKPYIPVESDSVTDKLGDNDKITDDSTTRPGDEFTSNGSIIEETSTDITTESGPSTEKLETDGDTQTQTGDDNEKSPVTGESTDVTVILPDVTPSFIQSGSDNETFTVDDTQTDGTHTTEIPESEVSVDGTTEDDSEKSPVSGDSTDVTAATVILPTVTPSFIPSGSDNEASIETVTSVSDQNGITTETPSQSSTNMPVKPTDLPEVNQTYTYSDYEGEISSTDKDATEITTIKTTADTEPIDEEVNDEPTGPVTDGTMSTDEITGSTEIYDGTKPSDISIDSATSIAEPIDGAISSEKPTSESATDIPTNDSKTTSTPTQEIQSEKPAEVETSTVTFTDTTDDFFTIETTSEKEPTNTDSTLHPIKFPVGTETAVVDAATTMYTTSTYEPYTFSTTEGYVSTVSSIEGELTESPVNGTQTIFTCLVNGYEYDNGSSIPVSSQCQESCVCYNGNVSCKLLVCPPAPPTFLRCASSIPEGECCPSYTCPPVETNTTESSGCIHEYEQYSEGEYVPSHDLCTDCYCLNGDVICANLECSTPSGQNCHPIERPPGSCCPTKYQCESVMPEIEDQIKTNDTDEQVTPITTNTVSASQSTESPDMMTGPISAMETRTTAPDSAKMTTPMLTTTENYEEITSTFTPTEEVEESSETVSVSSGLLEVTNETSQSGDTHLVTITDSTNISIEGISSTAVPSETGSHGNDNELGSPTVIPATESHSDDTGDITSPEKPGPDYGNDTFTDPVDKPSSSTPDEGVSTSTSSEDGYKTTISATTDISESDADTLTSTPSYGESSSNTDAGDIANTDKPATEDDEIISTTSSVETGNEVSNNQNATDSDKPGIDSEYQTTLIDASTTEGTPTTSDDGNKFDSGPDSDIGNTINGTESSVISTSTPDNGPEHFETKPPSLAGIPGEGSCLVNNTTYANGEDIPTRTFCQESCTCHNSIISCTLKPCPSPPPVVFRCEAVENPEQCCPTYNCPSLTPNNNETSTCLENGKIFTHGEFVPSQDICTDCYCLNGEVVCATLECPKPMGKNCKIISIREGSCCPEIYECDDSEDNTTPQPDDQDVIIIETTTEAYETTEGNGATTINEFPTDPTKVDISTYPDQTYSTTSTYPDQTYSTTEVVNVSDGISNTEYDTTTYAEVELSTPWYVTLSSTAVDEATSEDSATDAGFVETSYKPSDNEATTPFTSLDHQQTNTSSASEFTDYTESTSPTVTDESSTIYPSDNDLSSTEYPGYGGVESTVDQSGIPGISTDYPQSTMVTFTDKTSESDEVPTITPTDGSSVEYTDDYLPSQHPILFPTTPGSTTVTQIYEETGTGDITSTVDGSTETDFYTTTGTYLPEENITDITDPVEGSGEENFVSTTATFISNETVTTDIPSEEGFGSSTVTYLTEETVTTESTDPLTEVTPIDNELDASTEITGKTTDSSSYTDKATTEYPEEETPPTGDVISTRDPSGYGSSTEYPNNTQISTETTPQYPLTDDGSEASDNQTSENEVSVTIPSTTVAPVDVTVSTEISGMGSVDPLYETTPYTIDIYTTPQVGGDITDELTSMDSLSTVDQGDSTNTHISSDYTPTDSPALPSSQKTSTVISGHFTTLFPEIPNTYETTTEIALISDTVPISGEGSNTVHQGSMTTESSTLIILSHETSSTTETSGGINETEIPSTKYPLVTGDSNEDHNVTSEDPSVSEGTDDPSEPTEHTYTTESPNYTSKPSVGITETTTVSPVEILTQFTKYPVDTSEDQSISGGDNEDIDGKYTTKPYDYTTEPSTGIIEISTEFPVETENPSTMYTDDTSFQSVTSEDPSVSESTDGPSETTEEEYTTEYPNYTSKPSVPITESSTVLPVGSEDQSVSGGDNEDTDGKYTTELPYHTTEPTTGITEISTEFPVESENPSTMYTDDTSFPSFTTEDPSVSESTDGPSETTDEEYTTEYPNYTSKPSVPITESSTVLPVGSEDQSVSGGDNEDTDGKYTTELPYTTEPTAGITEISTEFPVETENPSTMYTDDTSFPSFTTEDPSVSESTDGPSETTDEEYTTEYPNYTSKPSVPITESSTVLPVGSEDQSVSGGDNEDTDGKYTTELPYHTTEPTAGIITEIPTAFPVETENPSTMYTDDTSFPSFTTEDPTASEGTDGPSEPIGITETSTVLSVEDETQFTKNPEDTNEDQIISGGDNEDTDGKFTTKPDYYTSEPSAGISETSTVETETPSTTYPNDISFPSVSTSTEDNFIAEQTSTEFPIITETESTEYPEDTSVQTTDIMKDTSEKPTAEDSSGCLIGEIFYENDTNVPSSSLCQENCKCSNGMVLCQKPSCTAPPGFLRCSSIPSTDECCPSYNCTQPTDLPETESPPCTSDGEIYTDGEYVPSLNECTDCYCLGGEIVCAQLQCISPGDNCQPISKSNTSCCPDRYECVEPTNNFENIVTPGVIETTSVGANETSDNGDILITSSPTFSTITVTGRPLVTEMSSSTVTSEHQDIITITEASVATDGLESTLTSEHKGTATITEASVATDGLDTTWNPIVTVTEETYTQNMNFTTGSDNIPQISENDPDDIHSIDKPGITDSSTVTGFVTDVPPGDTNNDTIHFSSVSPLTTDSTDLPSTQTDLTVSVNSTETTLAIAVTEITGADIFITEGKPVTDDIPSSTGKYPGEFTNDFDKVTGDGPITMTTSSDSPITVSSGHNITGTSSTASDTSSGKYPGTTEPTDNIAHTDSTDLPSTQTDLTVSVNSTETTLAIAVTEITGADIFITEGKPVTDDIPSSTGKYPGEFTNDIDKVTGDGPITMTTSSDSLITESSGHNITGTSSTASDTSSGKYPGTTEPTDNIAHTDSTDLPSTQTDLTVSVNSTETTLAIAVTEITGADIFITEGKPVTDDIPSSTGKYPGEFTNDFDKVTGDGPITMTTSSDSPITVSSGHNITGTSSTASDTSSGKYPGTTEPTDNIAHTVTGGEEATTAGYPIVFPDPSSSTPQISVPLSTNLPTSSFSNSTTDYSTPATEKPASSSSTGTDDDSMSVISTKPFPPYPGLTSPTYPTTSTSSVKPESTTEFVLGPGACLFDGKVYVSAQQIPRDDPCDFCFCFRGDIICLQQSCPPPIPGCYEEPIAGFCCPRYECPVTQAVINVTTTTTPIPFYPSISSTKTVAMCEIADRHYNIGELVEEASGPCLECRCGEKGMMACDPKDCEAQQVLRKILRTKYRR
ncbi:serine-rich adhesin for platelets-like [Palaemon carinicauda]|uniref:serine-rich adhesin for platelets-like n=1 Tax=Palaemon carinicauda TaxID=392227 RepID=UPI0035B66113